MNYPLQPRITRHGRGAIAISARPGNQLHRGELERFAPALFKSEAHSSRSDRYRVVETHELLDRLAEENFVPVKVQIGGSKTMEKREFTKHAIRFRQADDLVAEPAKGDAFPEVVLVNSHDGTSSYQLHAGLFRLVCLNGLVISSENWGSVKVGHHGNSVLDKVIEGTYTVLDAAKQSIEHADAMRGIPMTHSQEIEFGEQALKLRWPEETPWISGQSVARARRFADTNANDPSNLWLTFNKVQENLIRGGLVYTHTTPDNQITRRRSRAVQSVDGDMKLNRQLWDLARTWAADAGYSIAA